MTHRLPIVLLFAAGAFAACSDASTAPPGRVLDGQYGGQDVGLDVTAANTFVSLDCAGGEIDGPIVLAGDGTFDVSGTVTGAGNANGADHTPHAVRYRGRATREVVRLTIVTSDSAVGDTLVAVLGAPRYVAAC